MHAMFRVNKLHDVTNINMISIHFSHMYFVFFIIMPLASMIDFTVNNDGN